MEGRVHQKTLPENLTVTAQARDCCANSLPQYVSACIEYKGYVMKNTVNYVTIIKELILNCKYHAYDDDSDDTSEFDNVDNGVDKG